MADGQPGTVKAIDTHLGYATVELEGTPPREVTVHMWDEAIKSWKVGDRVLVPSSRL